MMRKKEFSHLSQIQCIIFRARLHQAISQVEMGVIDQQRAYLYLTIEPEPTSAETAERTRKFLIPYAEYELVRQQLSAALPNARWLLP